jgi:hypothetical protein
LELIPEAAGKTTVIYLGASFPSSNGVEETNLLKSRGSFLLASVAATKIFCFSFGLLPKRHPWLKRFSWKLLARH